MMLSWGPSRTMWWRTWELGNSVLSTWLGDDDIYIYIYIYIYIEFLFHFILLCLIYEITSKECQINKWKKMNRHFFLKYEGKGSRAFKKALKMKTFKAMVLHRNTYDHNFYLIIRSLIKDKEDKKEPKFITMKVLKRCNHTREGYH